MINLTKFYKENKDNTIQIPMSLIVLKESIHKKNTPTEIFPETDKPIVAHLIGNGKDCDKFRLIIGWKEYHSALQHNKEFINVILVPDKNRYCFIRRMEGKQEFPLKRIFVSRAFLETSPAEEKINRAIEYYKLNNCFDKPVVVDRNNYIVDGYTRYLAAMQLGIKRVPVKVV